jgi:hypothetical protein
LQYGSPATRVGGTPESTRFRMKKVKLSLEELSVESFNIEFEEDLGTVLANVAPTARTRECPCIESISCYC